MKIGHQDEDRRFWVKLILEMTEISQFFSDTKSSHPDLNGQEG